MSFSLVGAVFRIADLKPNPRLLLLALAEHADDAGDSCYPSVERLSAFTGFSERAVQENIKRLTELGFLTVILGGGRGATNRYILKINPAEDAPFSADKPSRNCPVSVDKTPQHFPETPQITTENPAEAAPEPLRTLKEPTTRDARGVVEDLFDDFWEAYPHRIEETAARRAWGKVANAQNADAIIAAAEVYAGDDRVKRGYPKKPANWLLDGCWQDAPSQPASGPAPSTPVDLDALAALWAPKIVTGAFVPSSAISAALARHMVGAGLVTRAQLRKVGIAA